MWIALQVTLISNLSFICNIRPGLWYCIYFVTCTIFSKKDSLWDYTAKEKVFPSKPLEDRLPPKLTQRMLVNSVICRIPSIQPLLLESEWSWLACTSIWGYFYWSGQLYRFSQGEYIQQEKEKKILISQIQSKRKTLKWLLSSNLKRTFLAWISSTLPLRYLIIKVYAKKLMMQTRVLPINLGLFSII